MSLYPSLEDMQMDQILMEGHNVTASAPSVPSMPYPLHDHMPSTNLSNLYPHMNDYMGLDLTSDELQMLQQQQKSYNQMVQAQQIQNISKFELVAPISGGSKGVERAKITHGLREVILCKDSETKIGLRVKSMNKGVFVVLVTEKSPAALAGLRFGDQILQIDGKETVGQNMDTVHSQLRKAGKKNISLIIRDRPFERTVTLHKDNGGIAGFTINKGRIDNIVVNSSASRNGLLIDHHILEVNGQNVVGMEDKLILKLIGESDVVLTITIMPSIIYEHMISKMAKSLFKKLMDHNVYDF